MYSSPTEKGAEKMFSKERKGAKVIRKSSHGDSRRAAGVRAKGGVHKSAYTAMNGSFRVLFPVTPTKTSKRVLSSAVSSVVAKMKG